MTRPVPAAAGISATDLTPPCAEYRERRKAHGLLASICDWLVEGLDMPDLEDAKAPPEELQRHEFDFGYSPTQE